MSLWDWIKERLFGVPPSRDVSRLEPGSGQRDAVTEAVDTGGGPLKPGHRRRAIRDRRLFPKARTPIGRRPRVMKPHEARRLFSASLLTRNRSIRDLAPDEEQLKRYGLPLWRTEDDLARALELSLGQLRWLSIHRERESCPHYVTFAIPKATGGERLIMAPKRRLRRVQRRLHELLVSRLPVSPQAHGFRPRRSVKTGAEQHLGKPIVLHLDLADFFPTLAWHRVRGLLIAYGYSYPVATVLALLMTEAERQPVEVDGKLFHVPVSPRYCPPGAPTSPGLGNALLLRLDRRLIGLARKFGFAYTRYADDLTFSGEAERKIAYGLVCRVREVVEAEGFSLNDRKTRFMGSGRRQTVTGVVVNRVLGLSRNERRRLRAALHQHRGEPDPQLLGKLAYLWMLNPQQAMALWPADWPRPRRAR
ncbi:MAG: RNA-directed DNA polymerase [Armatimonadetes bacterium]|nr:RNA-directed DNA polymerase [Armatimonadota bacterium]